MRSRINIRPNEDNLSACLGPTPLMAEIELLKLNESVDELLLEKDESCDVFIFNNQFEN